MEKLEFLYQQNLDIEAQFRHKAILAILPECHALSIEVLTQGLQELGIKVYVIGKPNINSWFMDEVIDDLRRVKFDFVLGSFRWGTRWDHYDKFNLHNRFKVLIDTNDNRGAGYWKGKHAHFRKRFRKCMPPEEIAGRRVQPYRWIMPIGDYEPDLVFASQNDPRYKKVHYLPFGIARKFLELYEGKTGKDRRIDFTYIPGAGPKRKELAAFLAKNRLPGRTFNKTARGERILPEAIVKLIEEANPKWADHYRASALWGDYFKVLNDTKVLIYPGLRNTAHWESSRPWEGYASGCLVLLREPNIDMSEFPVTELCKKAVYNSLGGLVGRCKWLYNNQDTLEKLRLETVRRALKYFTPAPIARHFLSVVRGAM